MWRAGWQRLTSLLAAIINWRYFKPAVFIACAVPLVLLGIKFCQLLLWNQSEALGIDPVKTLEHETGEDALGILLATLAVTPIRRIFKINRIQIVRRMLGLWAFTYALLHVSTYLIFDRNCYSWSACQFDDVWADLVKRKFIFAGMVAFTSMLMLALTSTAASVRLLKKNWIRLHRLIYVSAIAAIVHFIWIQKADISEPLNWAFWLTVLLAIRVYFWWRKRKRPQATGRRLQAAS